MKYTTRCNICAGVSNYDLQLLNVSLNRNRVHLPSTMKLGLNLNIFDIKSEVPNKFDISMVYNLVGLDMQKNDIEDKAKDDNNCFEIELFYKLVVTMDDNFKIDENNTKTEEALQEYAWFFAYPTIKDTINNLANRMDLPNLNVPFNLSKDMDVDDDEEIADRQ